MGTTTLVRFDNGRVIVGADYNDVTLRVTLVRSVNISTRSLRGTIWNPDTGEIAGQAVFLGGVTLTAAVLNGLQMVDIDGELTFPYTASFEYPAP